jgi:hypothetical protein
MERSACLLTRGASKASSGRIGWSRARWRVERYRMGKRAGTYND